MDLISRWRLRFHFHGIFVPCASDTVSTISVGVPSSPARFRFPFPTTTPPPLLRPPTPTLSSEIHAKRNNSSSAASEPVLKPNIFEEILLDEDDDEEEEQVLLDGVEEDSPMDDDDDNDFYLNNGFMENEGELYVGDGGGGGGVKLAGTWWDKEALAIAEAVCQSFDGDLGIYAFRTQLNSTIQVRIESLTNRSGSPTMEDIEAFSTTYRSRLNEAELSNSIPDNITLEVSSPGVERIIRIPQDLERFKDRPMYVKYVSDDVTAREGDGIFKLVSFDVESRNCIWGVADVRVNREKAGKGRPLSKKQREWRLQTSFDSLRLVRLHSEC